MFNKIMDVCIKVCTLIAISAVGTCSIAFMADNIEPHWATYLIMLATAISLIYWMVQLLLHWFPKKEKNVVATKS